MRRIAIALTTIALISAACGSTDDTASTTAPAPTTTEPEPTTTAPTTTTEAEPTTTTAPSTTTTATGSSAGSLAVAETSLGDVVVDDEGFTLYIFIPDAQGDSTCEGQCAENWPPASADLTAGEGIDASLVGTAARPDGSSQISYDGWPLYRFAADTEPGDVNGQGINDVWFVIAPDGSILR